MIKNPQKAKAILTESEKNIIDNTIAYIKDHKYQIRQHYLSVKSKKGQNKQKDIFIKIDLDTYLSKLLDVSIVILTANYFEAAILNLNVYKETNQKIYELDGGLELFRGSNITEAYIMNWKSYTILHLHAPETGSYTPCGSADLVRYVNSCEYINPTCIISFGICFGTDIGHYSLGDTIIGSKIYPWSIGVKINREDWKIKCDDYIIDLAENAKKLYKKIDTIVKETDKLCPQQKARLGHMITSEAVLSSEQAKLEAIENAFTCKIVAGEMEGYGLAKEGLFYSSNAEMACVILKAICDWGAIKNIDDYVKKEKNELVASYKDQLQAYTAFCAFKTLAVLFEEQVFSPDNIIRSLIIKLTERYSLNNAIPMSCFCDYIEEYLEEENNMSYTGKYQLLAQAKRTKFVNIIKRKLLDEYLLYDPSKEMVVFYNT